MAPTPKSHFNPTPPTSSKSNQAQFHSHSKTPNSKHRLNFNLAKPSPNPKESPPVEHPVEVIGRIRNYPDRKEKPVSALQINSDLHSLRVRTDIGYRDFSFDGVSSSEEEDLDGFYKKFVESRINGVKLGDKCTIMMYGPTGSGKSHTMFGCAKQQGIVYKSLRDILGRRGEENDGSDEMVGGGTFVQVSVLEIYNEEIYDLLSTSSGGGGFSLGWSKSAPKVRLEVMGKKAKNATFISGTEAGKISKEIQKVEKRRIVKSTLCNERSSRSHCMIILDVPTVGGRLMLVDMAGSENIEQAGQSGVEAKMQTGKINQGNIALKRVVESIANGDSHVPFRDSKLTMLLQDSFEDDKSKILMILCASPDPKEMHKTISTLEYGAKAKCIIRGPHTPIKDKGAEDSSSAVILGSRIEAMDQFILKLQMENKLREKERNEAHKELMKKEEEISALRAKLAVVGEKGPGTNEEVINLKVNERTQMLKTELEHKIEECKKMADAFVELERRKMEERILQQQQELEILRRRLEEIESELSNSREKKLSVDLEGSNFAKRLLEIYADEDPGMEKSMDLDKSLDMDMGKRDKSENSCIQAILGYPQISNSRDEDNQDLSASNFANKAFLSTVYEEEEEEDEEDNEKPVDEEVQKEVIQEKNVCSFTTPLANRDIEKVDFFRDRADEESESQKGKDSSSSRQMRIQNIFTLCGNYRELYQHNTTPMPTNKMRGNFDSLTSSPVRTIEEAPPEMNPFSVDFVAANKPGNKQNLTAKFSDENCKPLSENTGDLEVYVKWEASKDNPGKLITTLKVIRDATLADLRKLIEIYLGADNQAFTFLVLGDPTGAPVPREEEGAVQVTKLPICNNQLRGHLACLRPAKKVQGPNHLPFSSLENKLPLTPIPPHLHKADGFLAQQQLSSTTTPFY